VRVTVNFSVDHELPLLISDYAKRKDISMSEAASELIIAGKTALDKEAETCADQSVGSVKAS
jgi:hypothetical protein